MAVSSKKATKAKLKKAGAPGKTGTTAKKSTTRRTGMAKSASKRSASSSAVTVNRRRNGARRTEAERRAEEKPVVTERRQLERRATVQRRRQIDPTTCERDYTDEEIEFMNALDDYKRKSGRMFPTCSEILEVVKDLGYAKLHSVATSSDDALAQPITPA